MLLNTIRTQEIGNGHNDLLTPILDNGLNACSLLHTRQRFNHLCCAQWSGEMICYGTNKSLTDEWDFHSKNGWSALEQKAFMRVQQIPAQREEIMEAFIAKYGFEPERFVQIEQHMKNGLIEWSVRRRSDQEMADLSARSAAL